MEDPQPEDRERLDDREPTRARQTSAHPERTINEESPVDEASFESFPASDAPSWTGTQMGPPPSAQGCEGGGALDGGRAREEDAEEEPPRG